MTESQRYATEKDSLLADTSREEQQPSRHQRPRKPILLLLSVALVVALVYLLCEYTPKVRILNYKDHTLSEENLIQFYAKEAEQALQRLNNISNNKSHSSMPAGCEATVLIFRHCEDLGGHDRYEDGTSHCSYLGFQRSIYLSTLFGNSTESRWPLPRKLYGVWNKDGTNKRQYETLRPLSDKSGVPIEMFRFESAPPQVQEKVFHLLATGTFCNQVIAIAWKHAFIRALAATLGCDQERGCPDQYGDYDFDTVWELQYVYKPEQLRAHPASENVYQHQNKSLVRGWKVFGSVTHENFDALAFKFHDSSSSNSVRVENNWMKHEGHV